MVPNGSGIGRWLRRSAVLLIAAGLLFGGGLAAASDGRDGAALYRRLAQVAGGQGDPAIFEQLNTGARQLDWSQAREKAFTGHLRIIRVKNAENNPDRRAVYLLRELTGEVYILETPADTADFAEGVDTPYAGLDAKFESKLELRALHMPGNIGEVDYRFARLAAAPVQPTLDRIFKIAIILMLFFVMVGMGLTLTFKDFALVFTKPRGIVLGQVLQFGFMPLLAMTIALLIQDAMGDFFSSMFVTSGLFGLIMYVAGIIAIFLYKPLLPVTKHG